MKAVILAGGLGTRLKPFTEVIPKPLLPIGGKAILELQIQRFQEANFSEIYLATNYKSDYISQFIGDGSRYGVTVKISKEQKPLGTAGPLNILHDELTEQFIVMNGDILSLIDFDKFYKFSQEMGTCLTIAIKKDILPYDFGNIFFKDDYVIGIEEKPNFELFIVAGIYSMTPDIFQYIPDNEYFGMDDLIRTLLKENVPIAKYEMDEYWLDIGRVDDYEYASKEYLKKSVVNH